MAELALVGGRVLDPGAGIDEEAALVVRDGLVAAVGGDVPESAEILDVTGLLVVPGLVDLHTHVYWGVSHYGVDPDRHCLGRGTTTAVDTGSAGAQTFPGFRRYVIERARTRILPFLHVGVAGMISPLVGELEDMRWASVDETVACAREHADLVAGVKVRLGWQMVGRDPEPALRAARDAADRLSLPLMVHVIDMPKPIGWLLPFVQEGDVVTHCFHGNEGGILDESGRVETAVRAAAERGVVFDIGHGIGSYAWRVARAAASEGFWPQTISSDVHAHNVDGPVYDQPTTLSKLLHLGMPLADVIHATTAAPAAAVRRAESLGSLQPGRVADVTVLEVRSGAWSLTDGAHETVVADELLIPRHVVAAGVAEECENDAHRLSAETAVAR